MTWRSITSIVLLVTLIASAQAEDDSTTITGVVSVVDGDTLDLGPIRIRLNGIDAPEPDQVCAADGGGTWRCGEAATARLEELADGQPGRCEAFGVDGYGRIIGRCEIDGIDVNEAMMREGLAWAFRRYSQIYVDIEEEASSAGLGVWQAPTQSPWEWRDDAWNRACTTLGQSGPSCCPIKGNISQRTDERIYHTPWSPSWKRTVIDEAAGERWFCDEAQAVAAGWRAPRGR